MIFFLFLLIMISHRKQNKNKPFVLVPLEEKREWEINYLKRKCCVAIISEAFFSHGKDFFASTLLSGCLRITFEFLLIMFLSFLFLLKIKTGETADVF